MAIPFKLLNMRATEVGIYAREYAVPKAELIFTDPPFGTGKVQSNGSAYYMDELEHDDVLKDLGYAADNFMADDGTMVIVCDYRLAYYVVPHLLNNHDLNLRGEIIWEFGLGRPRTDWWPNRHNHLLTFTKKGHRGKFNPSAMPRERRLAPKKGYPDDKPAGSVWNYTMSNTDPERVEYPNQKSTKLIDPFILAHTEEGDTVIDIFCGSGSTGVSALKHGRKFVGLDINPVAIEATLDRLTS